MIDKILEERGNKCEIYGDFEELSRLSQQLKDAMRRNNGWSTLGADQKEALDMIAHKIARSINGDHSHKDNWNDIEGYAARVSRSL